MNVPICPKCGAVVKMLRSRNVLTRHYGCERCGLVSVGLLPYLVACENPLAHLDEIPTFMCPPQPQVLGIYPGPHSRGML